MLNYKNRNEQVWILEQQLEELRGENAGLKTIIIILLILCGLLVLW